MTADGSTAVKMTKTGKILVGLTGGVAIGLTVICGPFISPALRKVCLPYVPATNKQISNIIEALQHRSGSLLDVGSGDGRIVLQLARLDRFKEAHGVELNPWLVLYSKIDSFRAGLHSKTRFVCRNLWRFHFKPYDNIVIFGVDQMMGDLEKKFIKECTQGCHIVACRFPLPTKQPVKVIGNGIDKVWVYEMS